MEKIHKTRPAAETACRNYEHERQKLEQEYGVWDALYERRITAKYYDDDGEIRKVEYP